MKSLRQKIEICLTVIRLSGAVDFKKYYQKW